MNKTFRKEIALAVLPAIISSTIYVGDAISVREKEVGLAFGYANEFIKQKLEYKADKPVYITEKM